MALPADDLSRTLSSTDPDSPQAAHPGVVGDTYTLLIEGKDSAGQFCLIDMHVPHGGGPPPHRHDFEETFTVLEGEIVATFRGEERTVSAGTTLNIPANAPHEFTNRSGSAARLLCLCSPAGQDEFFREIGQPLQTRTETPRALTEVEKQELQKKTAELAPRFKTELLKHA